MRRLAIVVAGVLGCTTTPPPSVDPPPPTEAIWGESIRAGDLIVAVPGTGCRDDLGAWIDATVAPHVLDARANPRVNPIVLEQAIAATLRAGFSANDIADGAVTFAIWGSGAIHTPAFDYVGLGGVRARFVVLGGSHAAAVGGPAQNLGHYNTQTLDTDARDLYARTHAFLARAPSPAPRHVIVVAHSWGGAIAEYLASHLASYARDAGALPDAALVFAFCAGVPGLVPGYRFLGEGLRYVTSTSADGAVALELAAFEVDRPDDPVHALDPSGDMEGHQYDIVFGDSFQGSYGITTMALSCRGVPGRCP